MTDERKFSVREVRKTIATSMGTAFGLVIGLLWNNVVSGGLKVAGIDTTFVNITPIGWVGYAVTAIVLTVAMVILIVVVGRWGSK